MFTKPPHGCRCSIRSIRTLHQLCYRDRALDSTLALRRPLLQTTAEPITHLPSPPHRSLPPYLMLFPSY